MITSFTKIVATIGPSCDTVEKIHQLITEGVSVFRFNLKHNTQKWHSLRIQRVGEAAKKIDKPVAVLLDLQGPEIRLAIYHNTAKIELKKNEIVYFVTKEGTIDGKEIVLNNLELLKRLNPGQKIFVGGGAFEFAVLSNKKGLIKAKVCQGGVLASRKSVNVPGVELSIPTLAKKDLEDIALAARSEVDFIALSFVRTGNDIEVLRNELLKQKIKAGIIAKIETKQALEHLDEIIKRADGVMVARGDLGVEVPVEQVPYYQKEIIKKCAKYGKPVITATQMLESMVFEPQPTRAEVSDVANAIYDKSDAVMLSAESAIGKYPERAVAMMRKIALFSEKKTTESNYLDYEMKHQTAAITFGAKQLLESEYCQKENIKMFVVLTEGGMSARMLSRLRPNLPIVALTRKRAVADQLCLVWGVIPLLFDFGTVNLYAKKESSHIEKMLAVVKKEGFVITGEKVIMIYGEDWGTPGKTSVIRIQEVK